MTRLDRRFRNDTRPRARGDWFRLVTNQANHAELYLYDEIGYFGTSASDVVAMLAELNVSTMDLHLNSYGGEVFDGIAIYECLRVHPADITTYVDGIAASIASVIAMAGNRVVMGRNAQMMIHNASGGCWGNADDMRETATLLDRVSANIANIYADRTGVPAETWQAAMSAETWYFGSEAVDAGLADELAPMHGARKMDPEPDPECMTARLSMFRYAGRGQAPPPVIVPRQTPPPPAVEPSPVVDQGAGAEDPYNEIARLLKEVFQ